MRVLVVALIVALAQGGFLQQQDASAVKEPKVQEEEEESDDEDGPFDGSDMEDINPPADSFLQTDDVTDDVDEVEDTKDEIDGSEISLEADDEDGNDASEDGSLEDADGSLEDADSTNETTDETEDETTDSTDKSSDEAEEKQVEAKILLSVEEEEAEEFQVPSKECGVCTKGLWAKEVPTIKACMQDQGSTASKLKAEAHQKVRHDCGVEARMRVRKSKKCDSQCASVKQVTPTCKTCVVSLWKAQGAPDFRKKVKVCKDVRCKREVAKGAHLKMRALAKAQCKRECKVSAALLSVETEDFEEEALEAADEVQAAPVKKEVKKVAKKEEKAEIKYDKKKFAKDWHKEWEHGDVPSYKETYSKDTFPGRKAVVAAEDAQSDGKPGPAGLAGPVGAHLKHSADGTITR